MLNNTLFSYLSILCLGAAHSVNHFHSFLFVSPFSTPPTSLLLIVISVSWPILWLSGAPGPYYFGVQSCPCGAQLCDQTPLPLFVLVCRRDEFHSDAGLPPTTHSSRALWALMSNINLWGFFSLCIIYPLQDVLLTSDSLFLSTLYQGNLIIFTSLSTDRCFL